jgi:outer membrane lipoprotein-sorting protein
MPRIVFMSVLLCIAAGKLCAQYPGFSAVPDVATFRKVFSAESKKVISIRSDFTQEKELIALTEKLTSTGKFWFKRNNLVRIDYEKPFVYRMIMDGNRIYIKDDGKENTVNVKSNKLFQQVNRIMLDCIQGTITESNDFKPRVFESGSKYLLELTPVGKSLKDLFAAIVLTIDKKTSSVDIIEMKEVGGDRTRLIFTDKAINQPIGNEVFAF